MSENSEFLEILRKHKNFHEALYASEKKAFRFSKKHTNFYEALYVSEKVPGF